MTEEAGQNVKPLLEVDSEGKIWLAWQGNREDERSIYTRYYDGKQWSPEIVALDYRDKKSFDLAADREGKVWVGWNADALMMIVGASYYWKEEWHSVGPDTIDAYQYHIDPHIGSGKLFFHEDSLRMVISSLPPISYDLDRHSFEKLTNAEWYEAGVNLCGISQVGDEKVWAAFQITWGFPTTGGWRGQFPTAYFFSGTHWTSLEITAGASSGPAGYTVYYNYVSAKSVGSDAQNRVYVTCAVDNHPESRVDPNSSYEELITILNLHLEVWAFDTTTGDTLSRWNLGDTEGSGITYSWQGDGIEVATTDESEIVGFAISRNGDTSLRALRDSIWYKPVSLEHDSTVTSAHPSAVVDHLGNIWVAWDDGKDIYVSTVKISDMEVDEVLTSVESDAEDIAAKPARFFLAPNYPNPFNVSTSIVFQIPFDTVAELSVYDLLGQRVRVLISGDLKSGEHRILWDGKDDLGRDVSSGVYFCKLSVGAGEWTQTRKMVLLR